MDAHPCFPAILQRGATFDISCSLPWPHGTSCLLPFQCGIRFWRLSLAPWGANIFLQELVPIEMAARRKMAELPPLQVYLVTLSFQFWSVLTYSFYAV